MGRTAIEAKETQKIAERSQSVDAFESSLVCQYACKYVNKVISLTFTLEYIIILAQTSFLTHAGEGIKMLHMGEFFSHKIITHILLHREIYINSHTHQLPHLFSLTATMASSPPILLE